MVLVNDEFLEEAKEVVKEEVKEEMKYDFWENLRETLQLINEFFQNLFRLKEIFGGGFGIQTIDQMPVGTHTNPNIPNVGGIDIKNMVFQEIKKNPKIIVEIVEYAQNYFGDIKLSELKQKLLDELGIKNYGKE